MISTRSKDYLLSIEGRIETIRERKINGFNHILSIIQDTTLNDDEKFKSIQNCIESLNYHIEDIEKRIDKEYSELRELIKIV